MFRKQQFQYNMNQITNISHSPACKQSSQIISHQMQGHQTQQIPLIKTRSFSHKKLTITSATPTHSVSQAVCQNDGGVKKVVQSNDMHRFFKPPQYRNIHQNYADLQLLNSSKKNSILEQNNKSSLKLSVAISQVNSPQKSRSSKTQIQMQGNQTQMNIPSIQIQKLRQQINQKINQKCQFYMHEINTQYCIINTMRIKIQNLENEVKNKTSLIQQLVINKSQNSQKNCKNCKNAQNISNKKLKDLQNILVTLTSQINVSQTRINSRLDSLTRQLVQMNINRQSKEITKLKNILDANKLKLSSWIVNKEQTLQHLQTQSNRILKIDLQSLKSFDQLKQLKQKSNTLNQKLQKLQKQFLNNRELENTIKFISTDTKDSINYWETFEDFAYTNRSENQIRNVSIFGQDDFFFHPQNKHNQKDQFKVIQEILPSQDINSFGFIQNKANTCTKHINYSSSVWQSSQMTQCSFVPINNSLQSSMCEKTEKFSNVGLMPNVIDIMEQIRKNYKTQMPIVCKIDEQGHIIIIKTNQMMKNSRNMNYFKVSQDQKQILINRKYIVNQTQHNKSQKTAVRAQTHF